MYQIWHKWLSRGQISSNFSRTFSQLPKTPNKYLSSSKAAFNPEKNWNKIWFVIKKVVFMVGDVIRRLVTTFSIQQQTSYFTRFSD